VNQVFLEHPGTDVKVNAAGDLFALEYFKASNADQLYVQPASTTGFTLVDSKNQFFGYGICIDQASGKVYLADH
jgi:hypothetical protein